MITDTLLNWLFGAIEAMVRLLPDGQGILIPESPAWDVLATANLILPLDHVITMLGVAGSLMVVGLTYWGVMKAVNLIRGSGA